MFQPAVEPSSTVIEAVTPAAFTCAGAVALPPGARVDHALEDLSEGLAGDTRIGRLVRNAIGGQGTRDRGDCDRIL